MNKELKKPSYWRFLRNLLKIIYAKFGIEHIYETERRDDNGRDNFTKKKRI